MCMLGPTSCVAALLAQCDGCCEVGVTEGVTCVTVPVANMAIAEVLRTCIDSSLEGMLAYESLAFSRTHPTALSAIHDSGDVPSSLRPVV